MRKNKFTVPVSRQLRVTFEMYMKLFGDVYLKDGQAIPNRFTPRNNLKFVEFKKSL